MLAKRQILHFVLFCVWSEVTDRQTVQPICKQHEASRSSLWTTEGTLISCSWGLC